MKFRPCRHGVADVMTRRVVTRVYRIVRMAEGRRYGGGGDVQKFLISEHAKCGLGRDLFEWIVRVDCR